MQTSIPSFEVATVTLNPAIDRTVTIPNFTVGIVNRVEQIQSHPGGKGINVASALADHGHRVAATGFLGRANVGPFEDLFVEKKIADHFIRIAGQTRIGIKITDPVRTQTTDINFPGQSPTARDLDALQEKIATLEAGWFVLAGSIPPGVAQTIYRDLIAALRLRGKKVLLDASGASFPDAVAAAPNIIKPNMHEFQELVGRSLSDPRAVVEAAREIISRGIELVAVSMGKEGACFVTAGEAVVARPPDIIVQSTVGAGDAMVAGILSAHLQQLPLRECARLATAFSVDKLSRLGSGISSRVAVEKLMREVALA
jgi:1-phosphofructokinase family hexose kinase